jgi:hypothetical protein
MVLAKEGDVDKFNAMKPKLYSINDVFDDGVEYPSIDIDTPFLTTKQPNGPASHADQVQFKTVVDDFMGNIAKKSLVLRSRYGSGKTTRMQRLIKEHNPERVLFITYRRTLARDIMNNFNHLGFKSYLDSYEDPTVWDSKRLIVQIDSLMNLVLKNSDVICGEAFELSYDIIVVDESESLLNHCDETMEKKDNAIWEFLDLILKHSKKLIFMDGDMSQRSLGFASSYGRIVYVNNKNNETNKSINLICNQKPNPKRRCIRIWRSSTRMTVPSEYAL